MTLCRGVLVAVAVMLPACSSSDSAPPASGEGPGGSGLADKLCPDACAAAATCYPELDVPACIGQCGKELAGSGHLAKDFAEVFFQKLFDAKSDPGCGIVNLTPWDEVPGKPYSPPMADPAALQPCLDNAKLCGPGDATSGCFRSYYIYAEQHRAAQRACWAAEPTCLQQVNSACLCAAVVGGSPWVGIPKPNDPLHPCPP